MRKRDIKPYSAILLAIFASSFVGVLSKLAAQHPFLSIQFLLYYGLALVILAAYSMVWQICLERVPLIIAYSLRGLLFVFVCIWSVLFFEEEISPLQVIGLLMIILGIGISQSNVE